MAEGDRLEEVIKNALTKRNPSQNEKNKLLSYINDKVIEGFEVIPSNKKRPSKKVKIKHEVVDYVSNQYFKFKPVIAYDEELKDWTIALDELNIFGEGNTYEEAVENLIDCVLDYEGICLENVELFSKAESLENQFYLRRIIKCKRDRKKIRKEMGL